MVEGVPGHGRGGMDELPSPSLLELSEFKKPQGRGHPVSVPSLPAAPTSHLSQPLIVFQCLGLTVSSPQHLENCFSILITLVVTDCILYKITPLLPLIWMTLGIFSNFAHSVIWTEIFSVFCTYEILPNCVFACCWCSPLFLVLCSCFSPFLHVLQKGKTMPVGKSLHKAFVWK